MALFQLMDNEIWISNTSHMSWNNNIVILKSLKNVKTLLRSQIMQKKKKISRLDVAHGPQVANPCLIPINAIIQGSIPGLHNGCSKSLTWFPTQSSFSKLKHSIIPWGTVVNFSFLGSQTPKGVNKCVSKINSFPTFKLKIFSFPYFF